MRVTMNHLISGTRNGAPWPKRGESIDLPDAEAAQLIASGVAVAAEVAAEAPVAPAAPVVAETTDAAPEGEQAVATPNKAAPRKRAARKV